jgi:Putative ABC exporter
MNRALWLLMGLQMRGWLRYLGKNLQTVRGALLALVGLGVFVPWLLSTLFLPNVSVIETRQLGRFGPAVLLLYCVANVVFSSHERAVYFSPAEVQFLFTGPFSRRQILAYKLLLTITVSVPVSLLMSAVIRVQHGWWVGVLLGLALVSVFMQLFSILLGLVAGAIGEHFYSRGRWVVGLAAVGAVGFVALQAGGSFSPAAVSNLGEVVFESQAWHVISWPLQAFFDVMTAKHISDLLAPLGISAAATLVLVAGIFAMDAHYLEASASASSRLYARLQRMRGRQVTVEEPTRARTTRFELPSLPYWGGIGPIFWRQLTTAMRGMGRVLLILFIFSIAFGGPMLASGIGNVEVIVPMLAGVGVWLSVFLTTLVPFDFRGDIDRMATLKTLPIVPWRLTVGQLLAPTLVLSLLQWVIVAGCAVLAPGQWLILLAIALYVPVYCFLLIALENLLFLLFPVRIMAATPGDFQALGRNVLLAVGKIVGLGVTLTAAGVVGFVVYLVTQNVAYGVAASWPVVALFGAALVPLVSLAFQWFDVGRDTPA